MKNSVYLAIIASMTASQFAFASADLKGKWVSACKNFARTTVTFTDTGDETLTENFLPIGTPCTSSVALRVTTSGVYKTGTSNVAGAKNLDETINIYTITPLDEMVAGGFNASGFCGIYEWVLNQPQDMFGIKCDENTKIINKGDKELNIYRIEGNKLMFGDAKNVDAAGRPLSLDKLNVFTKVEH